jgi:hypothetical protein
MSNSEARARLEEIKDNIAEFGCIADRDHEQWLIDSLEQAWKLEEALLKKNLGLIMECLPEFEAVKKSRHVLKAQLTIAVEALEQAYMSFADCASRVKAPDAYMLSDIKETLDKLKGDK